MAKGVRNPLQLTTEEMIFANLSWEHPWRLG